MNGVEQLVMSSPIGDPTNDSTDFEVKNWLLPTEGGETGTDDDLVEPPDPEVANQAHALIMVVDDLPDLRHLIADSLKRHHYQIITASNGQRALDLAKTHKPDLILTDWMMPKMSGPEFIQALKADTELSSTPVILLTAKSDQESKLLGTEVGADGFLSKPFNEQELTSVVRNLLTLKKH